MHKTHILYILNVTHFDVFFNGHEAFQFENFCIAIPPYLCIYLISVYWVSTVNMRCELLMRGDGNAWTNWIDSSRANCNNLSGLLKYQLQPHL